MTQWTTDQAQAIECRGKNVLVSAAAGSGKTALLIERIRRIVMEEGVDVSELLVLTFSRAAAAEMKERLNIALVGALENEENDVRRIMDQLHHLGSANISTMHAFCGTLIREYFQEAGVDPEFRMIDDAEGAIMIQEALSEVFEDRYAAIPEDGEDDFSRLVEMYTGNRDDEGLKVMVDQLNHFLNTLADGGQWCQEALSRLSMTATELWASDWGAVLKADVKMDCQAAQAIYTDCLTMIDGIDDFDKTREQLQTEIDAIERISKALDGDYAPFQEAIKAMAFPRYKGCKADKETSDIIKNARGEAKKIMVNIDSRYGGDLDKAMALVCEMQKPMADLIELTRAFQAAYRRRKEAKCLLDFNDLEQLTLTILANPEIATEQQRRYRYIILDEYQDTNEIQETIIQRIARDDNYFMVGDVKQSIYRFRLADPGIFLDKYKRFGCGDSQTDQLITLSKNFRSCQGVIDGVNGVFEKIMSPELGEVAYDNRAKLFKGLPANGPYEKVRIHVLEKKESMGDDEQNRVEWNKIEQEARFVARQIQAMVGKPYYNTKVGQDQILRYRDFGVLMRSVARRGDVFARVFAEEGIPTYYEGGSTYYESLEVVIILNLLTIIDNRDQDIPLTSVMLSPIGNFTVEDLAHVRLSGETKFLYDALWSYAKTQEDDLAVRIQQFVQQLDDWAFDAKTLAIEDFLWKLYQDTGYYTFVAALPGGAQRQSNLRVLLKRAAEYKRSTLKGIGPFISFIHRMKRHNVDSKAPGILSENDDVVRIMTIHKSKGLEFPVVFVAGLGGQFNLTESGRVLLHKTMGICPDLVRPDQRLIKKTIARHIGGSLLRRESLSEEMRLLYVAMTRARERLILVGTVSDLSKRQSQWEQPNQLYQLTRAKSLLDWIMLAVHNSQSVPIQLDIPDAGEKSRMDLGTFLVEMYSSGYLAKQLTDGQITGKGVTNAVSVSSEVADAIQKRLAWQYPWQDVVAVPEKMSVTDVEKYRNGKMDEQRNIPICQNRPQFMQAEQTRWSGAELGTGTHTILQALDLQALRGLDAIALYQTVATQAQAMVQSERIVPDLLAAIDLQPIVDFLLSDLGNQLLTAKEIRREVPFNYRIPAERISPDWQDSNNDITLQGMIDCCFMVDDGWILLDYKTDQYHQPGKKEALISHYQTQIDIYAEALATLTGVPVHHKYLYFLMMGEAIDMN